MNSTIGRGSSSPWTYPPAALTGRIGGTYGHDAAADIERFLCALRWRDAVG
ncbi:hypothetical protein [Actinoplanes sp. NPDC051851]|uniref:hypothetical protein n=1 Tax=Actinoplanes sp. NPDC051851 TaxID=3154753 RepID=UPI0034413AA2